MRRSGSYLVENPTTFLESAGGPPHTGLVDPFQTFDFRGCRFAYRMDGSGPPLVMIQGVGAYGTAWNPIIEILKNHYTCLTFDNRGIGLSQPTGIRLTVDQMAADAQALMDHAEWSSAHLVGHSLGGLIALQVALTDQARARSLSLLNTFARGTDARRMTLEMFWIALRLRLGTRGIRARAFQELVVPQSETRFKPDELSANISRVLGHHIGDIPEIVNEQLAALSAHDVTSRLGELSGIPTLVISGEKDPIARPSSGRAIASGIPDARYIEIPGASHAFPILDPEHCAELLLDHLDAAERERAAPA
jgi:pimeloyl-ACP methyl ester carboxylesterase